MYTLEKSIARFLTSRAALLSLLLVGLVLSLGASISNAQCGGQGIKIVEQKNSGTEFLIVFQQNATLADTDPGYVDLFIASTGDTATVTINCREFPLFSHAIQLGKNQSVSYRISDDITPLVVSSEKVENKVIRIFATSPIVCYGMNHKQFTADALLALPRNTATTDYRAMCYTNTPGSGPGDETQSQFAVAAFSDGTQVTITPAAQTLSGSPAGVPIKYTLDSGQCVNIQGDPLRRGEDMTSSIVTSNKPVVVFAGHVCAEVPVGATSCDHLCEMIPPTASWGQEFVATNFAPRLGGDIIRILALNDNTAVTMDGRPWVTLAAGKFKDTLISSAVTIETSGPALLGEFAHTAWDQGTVNGDPFFAIVPPLNQTYTDFTFFASQDPAYLQQFVIVVTETSGKGLITLDGTLVPSGSFQDLPQALGGLNYSIATLGISGGSHSISTRNDRQHGFTILSYGFGSFDSYGYTAGALLKPLRGVHLRDNGQTTQAASLLKRKSSIALRNILGNRVYVDSVTVQLQGDNAKFYTAKMHETYLDWDHIEMGDEAIMHIDVTPPNDVPLKAKIRAYTHTADWNDFSSSDLEMTILPSVANAVANEAISSASFASVYPNPFGGQTTISFNLQQHADMSLKIYDDLGRLVQTLVQDELAAGPYAIKFAKTGLTEGHYTYELISNKLNLRERGSLVLSR
ncbi:MAG: T9SS type A sorting domain-containing protein [Candidatus Kapaibacterium sp.]